MESSVQHRKLAVICRAIVVNVIAGSAAAVAASNEDGTGNARNPGGGDTTRRYDAEGLSQFKASASRSPSGLLYEWPFLPQAQRDSDGGWAYRSGLEYGYLRQDDEEGAAEFNRYQDFSEGVFINYFDLSLWNAGEGKYLDFRAGGVGRDDQYYFAEGGRYGKYAFAAYHDQIPQSYARNAVTVYQGVGTGNLTLPPTLTAGNNTSTQIAQALEQAYHPDLSMTRKQSGFALEYTPRADTTLFAGWELQKRDGSRPFGGAFFPPFYTGGNAGGMVETIEPLDHSANEFSGGLRYVGRDLQWNVEYNSSFFSNDVGQLTFDNPFINLPGTDFVVERGRIDLYPDNDFHQVASELTVRLPWQGQLFSTVSWSRSSQDDELLPFTVNSGLNFTGIDLGSWNRLDSLPRRSAGAEIDNLHFQIGVQLSPLSGLSVRSRIRYQDEDNKTDYLGRNSLTQELGYITVDGAYLGSVYRPGTPQAPIHYRSIPFARDSVQLTLDADYRLTARNLLGLKYQHEERRFDYRERDRVDESSVELFLSSRTVSWLTLRLSYEYAWRKGGSYDFSPYAEFYTASLPDFRPVLAEGPNPHTLADLRKFDLADRRQNTLSAKLNYLLGETMDVILSAKWTDNDYDARYGLQAEEEASLNLEWNYQPRPDLSAYAFHGFEDGSSDMANVNDSGFSTDPRAGGGTYPFESAWSESSEERSAYLGLGLRYLFGSFDLDSNYSYNRSSSRLRYLAASRSALASRQLEELEGSFPDLDFNRHILETSVRWHARDHLSMRVYHRYEKSDTDDWHYQGLTPLIGNHLFLNAQPESYAVHLVGISVQYRIE